MIKVKYKINEIDIRSPFQSFGETFLKRQSIFWEISDKLHAIKAEQCFYPKLIPELSFAEIEKLQSHLHTLPVFVAQVTKTKSIQEIMDHEWFLTIDHILKAHHRFAPQFMTLHWLWLKTQMPALASLFQAQKIQLSGLITNLNPDLNLEHLSTWKIKIARAPFSSEAPILAQLIKRHPTTQFRLDANDNLTGEELSKWIDWCDQFKKNISYIESPCKEYQEWNELIHLKNSSISLGHDLRKLEEMDIISKWSNLKSVIVKPSLISLKGVFQVGQQINQWNLPLEMILSSCFETPPGLNQIARMISFCPNSLNHFHGLATAAWVDTQAKETKTLNLGALS